MDRNLYLALLSTIVGYYLYIEGVTKIGGKSLNIQQSRPCLRSPNSALIPTRSSQRLTVVAYYSF